jgi:hypothetical protein
MPSTYPMKTKSRDWTAPSAHYLLFFDIGYFRFHSNRAGGRRGKGHIGIRRRWRMRLA